jgi:hypothetical protein
MNGMRVFADVYYRAEVGLGRTRLPQSTCTRARFDQRERCTYRGGPARAFRGTRSGKCDMPARLACESSSPVSINDGALEKEIACGTKTELSKA